ncbi:MAG: DinB family protein [Pseudomonadota bacterium]
MEMRDYAVLMATYNGWMNDKLYAAAAQLPVQELMADRGAFFGSVFGTLNHIVVADTVWLKRFATHPAGFPALDPVRGLPLPGALGELQVADMAALRQRRQLIDSAMLDWTATLVDEQMGHILHYTNSRGPSSKRFADLVRHFFNHQTHHRGQASTLLSQAGVDIGSTDLLDLIPNQA